MGSVFFFSGDFEDDGEVAYRDENAKVGQCSVEVLDNHGVPEIRINPLGESYKENTAVFRDLRQFERFVAAVNDLNRRLNPRAQ